MGVERPLHILLAAPTSTGGIGRHVAMLADGLVSRGQAVTVCAPPMTLERVGGGVARVPLSLGSPAHALPDLRRLRRLAAGHDVTHAHGVRVGAQAALAGASPLVVTWHNAPLGGLSRHAVHGLLERICARRAALVLGASSDLVARARAAGARRVALCAVAAGHPPADADPSSSPRLPRSGTPGPPVVLAVARLHQQKRLDLLIEAAAAWPDDADRPRFLVAGDGPLRADLETLARRAGAPVEFLGARDDVEDLLRQADALLLPSDWEARPLVVQEAMRAGVPVVATDVGGVRELVGDAAVLVPPGSSAALGQALRQVLTDQLLAQRLRREGPLRAATWPTADEMVDHVLAGYLDLCSTVSHRQA